MARLSGLTHRLYTGEISYDFIGHRRRWYLLSAILLTLSIVALLTRGLVFGIEFRGGADFKAPTTVTAQTVDSMHEPWRGPACRGWTTPSSTPSATTRSGCRPGRSTRPTEVPVVRGGDRGGGRDRAGRGGLQPDRRLLG